MGADCAHRESDGEAALDRPTLAWRHSVCAREKRCVFVFIFRDIDISQR